jgi:hypothetical protein
VEPHPLEEANEALARLRDGELRGAAVLVTELSRAGESLRGAAPRLA